MESFLENGNITDFRLALMAAAENNQVEAVRLILARSKVRVDMRFSNSKALEKGAARGYFDIVELLLQHRNADAYGTHNAMTLAAQGGHKKVVALLLPKCKELGVSRALAAAVMGKSMDTVELLVPYCARTEMGVAVKEALDSDQIEILELLLANCAPEQEQSYVSSDSFRRAVMSAAGRDDVKVLKLLMTKCGDNVREAMVWAVTKHNLGTVQVLFDYCKTENHLSIIQAGLEEAVQGGNIEMVKLISSQASPYGIADLWTKLGADVSTEVAEVLVTYSNQYYLADGVATILLKGCVDEAETLLARCNQSFIRKMVIKVASLGELEVAKMLLDKCELPTLTTIYHDAVATGSTSLACYLLEQVGCSADIQAGQVTASSQGHKELVEALVDKCGPTLISRAIELAARNGHVEIVELLRPHCDYVSITEAIASLTDRGDADAANLLRSKRARVD